MATDFFVQRPSITPTIYAYKLVGVASHEGYIKIGYTERDVEQRVYEQMHTSGVEYKILYQESSMCEDGSVFTDHDVHKILKRKGFKQLNAGADRNEWFSCSIRDLQVAIMELKTGRRFDNGRTATFKMRPEQKRAVDRTIEYFTKAKMDEPDRAPKFLWNAKMRFGKTFASYQLARKMGMRRILVLTFKPAVESAWHEDLVSHVDFAGWQFVSNKEAKFDASKLDDMYNACD